MRLSKESNPVTGIHWDKTNFRKYIKNQRSSDGRQRSVDQSDGSLSALEVNQKRMVLLILNHRNFIFSRPIR